MALIEFDICLFINSIDPLKSHILIVNVLKSESNQEDSVV